MIMRASETICSGGPDSKFWTAGLSPRFADRRLPQIRQQWLWQATGEVLALS
jgi:hypothetical protein